MFRLLVIILTIRSATSWTDNKQRRFTENFSFGVASSAYQIEGGWDADGKGPSIWDTFVRQKPSPINGHTSGDVAADSYNKYKRDVEMLRELGVDHYRFSVSWSRILPSGFTNDINEAGIEYYDNLINELVKYNIEPILTMYHFDLPQRLQDLGGWVNPLSVNWFRDYAELLMQRFSHKVKHWITLNQPNSICLEGYGYGIMAPGINMKGIGDYICVKNVLLAHGEVYNIFKKKYRRNNSMMGIALSINWVDPKNHTCEEDKSVADEFREFTIGLYMNPIFSSQGDFPDVVKNIISKRSKEQGYQTSRLPQLSKEEVELLQGSADFLAMNHYTTVLVTRDSDTKYDSPSFEDDTRVEITYGPEWRQAKSPWLYSAPYGIYKACLYLNKKYDRPPIIITENGWSSKAIMKDGYRVNYLRQYLKAILYAIDDGTDLRGYTVWSLMDNFEWTAGYKERFGLYQVDFRTPEKVRKARKSALVYRNIIETRVVDEEWYPKSLNISVSMRRLEMMQANPRVDL